MLRTFDEFLSDFNITPQEREQLVFHLAFFRAQKTIEALSKSPKIDPRDFGLRSRPALIGA